MVDGKWLADESAPKEDDGTGNSNNVLTPEHIAMASAPPTAALLSSAAPESSTAQLAKDAPLEKADKPSDLPGTFPETPLNDADKEFKVSPLPAAEGGLNPIKLAPGEKIPDAFKAGDVGSNVKLDQASYEKADTLPGVSTELPPISGNLIPESSLPITGGGEVTINTVTPSSTTAALAAGVPLEPKAPKAAEEAETAVKAPEISPEVPAEVKESIEEAGGSPEAAANTEAVEEKKAVEAELLKEVKPTEAAAESSDAAPAVNGAGSSTKADVNGTEATPAEPAPPAKADAAKPVPDATPSSS